jgi:hypothetical protein
VANISVASSHPLAGTSVVAVFDAATRPYKLTRLLLSECHITSLCFNHFAVGHLVIAGSAEGNVMVWDLREEPSSYAVQVYMYVCMYVCMYVSFGSFILI